MRSLTSSQPMKLFTTEVVIQTRLIVATEATALVAIPSIASHQLRLLLVAAACQLKIDYLVILEHPKSI